MQNNFIFLSKSCYENNYIATDQNEINSILATTDNYKFSLRSVISTLNQPIKVTYSSMLITWHIFPVSLIFPNSDRTLLCFHRPTHPTGTTLGVLFLRHHELTNEKASHFLINQSKTKTLIDLKVTRKPKPTKNSTRSYLNEIPAHFIHEIKTIGYDAININVFRKLMRFHRKKGV